MDKNAFKSAFDGLQHFLDVTQFLEHAETNVQLTHPEAIRLRRDVVVALDLIRCIPEMVERIETVEREFEAFVSHHEDHEEREGEDDYEWEDFGRQLQFEIQVHAN
jgi:hypothetical protein